MKHPLFLMPPSTPTHPRPSSPNIPPHSPLYHFSFTTFGSLWRRLHPNHHPSLQKHIITIHVLHKWTRVNFFPSQISHRHHTFTKQVGRYPRRGGNCTHHTTRLAH